MNRSSIARHTHITAMIVLGSLSLFHVLLTPIMFNELSGRLVWYVATDLGNVSLIFLNIAVTYVSTADRVPWRLCHGANSLAVGLGVLNLVAVPEPVNIAVLGTYMALALGAYGRDGRFMRSSRT